MNFIDGFVKSPFVLPEQDYTPCAIGEAAMTRKDNTEYGLTPDHHFSILNPADPNLDAWKFFERKHVVSILRRKK